MRKLWLLAAIAIMLPTLGFSQGGNWKFYRHELSFGVGGSAFLGELGGADQIGTNGIKDLEIGLTRAVAMIGYRYKISPYIALKGNLIYARLRGDDATTEELFRKNRNLHFRSPVVELSGQVEWYPFQERSGHLYRFKGVRGQSRTKFSPYLFTGIAGFWFNPQAQASDGNWYNLQPLGTEGQYLANSPVSPYKRIQISIPAGAGVKFNIDNQWSIGLEIGNRLTFTDYIDDVSGVYPNKTDLQTAQGDIAMELSDPSLGLAGSGWNPNGILEGQQRGDPTDNDNYTFAILSVNYKLLQGRLHLPKF